MPTSGRWGWWCCERPGVQLLANACGECLRESRMRETRTSGSRRGEWVAAQGMRILSHERGNPDTDVGRSLNTVAHSSTLPVAMKIRNPKCGNEPFRIRFTFHLSRAVIPRFPGSHSSAFRIGSAPSTMSSRTSPRIAVRPQLKAVYTERDCAMTPFQLRVKVMAERAAWIQAI
jgi:hypothetical protein